MNTKGGKQNINWEGILRIIQSIPSPKAEPFKRWLAKVGSEIIEEINNPELVMDRMKQIYEKKDILNLGLNKEKEELQLDII